MHVTIRPFGNSRGVIIPKPLLAQAGLHDEADIEVKDGTLVLSKPRPRVREGWAAAAQTIAAAVDDKQVLGEHALVDEEDWQW
jgi:antitoxin MazE